MRIVFGTGRYCRRSVKPQDLGITEAGNIRQFELTQRYGHLYWIPVFPLELSWCVRLSDDKLYEVHSDAKPMLKSIPYSWLSILPAFALPLLAIIGFSIWYVNDSIDHYRWKKQYEAEQKAELEKWTEKINHPSLMDYYHFTGSGDHYKCYAKVVGFTDNAVRLSFAISEPKGYDNKAEIVGILKDTAQNFPAVWIPKSTLIKLADKKAYKDTTLADAGKIRFDEIIQPEALQLKYVTATVNDGYCIIISNEGVPFKLIGTDAKESGIEATGYLPMIVESGDEIRFKLVKTDKSALSFTMDYEDHNGVAHKVQVAVNLDAKKLETTMK